MLITTDIVFHKTTCMIFYLHSTNVLRYSHILGHALTHASAHKRLFSLGRQTTYFLSAFHCVRSASYDKLFVDSFVRASFVSLNPRNAFARWLTRLHSLRCQGRATKTHDIAWDLPMTGNDNTYTQPGRGQLNVLTHIRFGCGSDGCSCGRPLSAVNCWLISPPGSRWVWLCRLAWTRSRCRSLRSASSAPIGPLAALNCRPVGAWPSLLVGQQQQQPRRTPSTA